MPAKGLRPTSYAGARHNDAAINTNAGIKIFLTWQWDYFIKDHLGNIRTVLTEQQDVHKYTATFETAVRSKETALFSNIEEAAFAGNNMNQSSSSSDKAVVPPLQKKATGITRWLLWFLWMQLVDG